ncbi:MAG TPA: peptidoglycan DD-metalloendopeptidase family protein, partial [Miltoncostaeaceae bacterium]|nr:peptidoglycan DD-metalloendopeptidase family protein [Miltoncostaeaceae bacterium]
MPLDSVVAADLLARILTDDAFRADFRRDPVATCRRIGLDDVADELARETARAFQTLEVRESRSSLAGVLLAAAAEGVGVAELVQHVRADAGGAGLGAGPSPAANALSRAMQTIHHAGAPQAGGAPGAPSQAAVGPPVEAAAVAPLPAPGAPIPVDPRAVPALAPLAARYDMEVASVPSEGGVSRVVISSVNGAPVSPTNVAARDLAQEMTALDPAARPQRVGTPWRIAGEGFVTEDGLEDRIEVDLPPGMSAGRASAVFRAVATQEPSAGRASAVFGAVEREAPAAPAVPAAPAAPADPAAPAAPAALADAVAPAAPAPGAPVQIVDPSLMTNTNAGGKLHGSEFGMPDAEGAPGPDGNRHAAYDFFARENAPIRSPIAGEVVEVRASRGTSGQIFGGTVKVRGGDGKVWVFRHVTPGAVSVGQRVQAGAEIAKVSPWTDGPEHAHIELWKTLGGGYNVANMEDPLPHLKAMYSGAPAPAPAAAADAAAAPSPAAPLAPAAAPAGGASALDPGRVVAIPAVRDELSSPDLD